MTKSENAALQAYKRYYIDRDYEQIDLFRLLRNQFGISSAIYPGSYIQVSPSFVFPYVVYIDSDRKTVQLFTSDALVDLVKRCKEYPEEPVVVFHGTDYRELIDEYQSEFDLLISQYAGFISDVCKPYLKSRGYLLVNNSHGDAGLASMDSDYELVAAVQRHNGKYRLSTAALDEYLILNKDITISRETLLGRKRGFGYKKTAALYIFQKVI